MFFFCFFFQSEDGIRDLVRSRGLGDVYKRQVLGVGDGALEALLDVVGDPLARELQVGERGIHRLSLIHI